jgi:hypothetical protein
MMEFVLLFGSMLIVMLIRVVPPIGVRIEGKPVGRVTLGFRERVRLHRTNVYAIGAVLLLVSATGGMPLIGELGVIAAVLGILAIPTRYILTDRGIALNRTVFRPWTDFDGFRVLSSGLELEPVTGHGRAFRVVLGPAKAEELSRTLGTFLSLTGTPRDGNEAARRNKRRGRWPTRLPQRRRTMASANS